MLNKLALRQLGSQAMRKVGLLKYALLLDLVCPSDAAKRENPTTTQKKMSQQHKDKITAKKRGSKSGFMGKLPKSQNKNNDIGDVNIKTSTKTKRKDSSNDNNNDNDNSNNSSNNNNKNNNSNSNSIFKPVHRARSRRKSGLKKSATANTNTNTNANVSSNTNTAHNGNDGEKEKKDDGSGSSYDKIDNSLAKSFDDLFYVSFFDINHLQDYEDIQHELVQDEWQSIIYYHRSRLKKQVDKRLVQLKKAIIEKIKQRFRNISDVKKFDEIVAQIQYEECCKVSVLFSAFFDMSTES